MTVKEKVLRHLQSGRSLTNLQALQEYGTMSLAYHVWALRQEGYDIRTRIRTNYNGRRYAEYYIPGAGVHAVRT